MRCQGICGAKGYAVPRGGCGVGVYQYLSFASSTGMLGNGGPPAGGAGATLPAVYFSFALLRTYVWSEHDTD